MIPRFRENEEKKLRSPACSRQKDAIFYILFTEPETHFFAEPCRVMSNCTTAFQKVADIQHWQESGKHGWRIICISTCILTVLLRNLSRLFIIIYIFVMALVNAIKYTFNMKIFHKSCAFFFLIHSWFQFVIIKSYLVILRYTQPD